MKFFEKRRKAKLYQQWVERAGWLADTAHSSADKSEGVSLRVDSPEAVIPEDDESVIAHIEPDSGIVTHPEVTGNMMAEIDKGQPRLLNRGILYMLLGVAVVIFYTGLILFIVLSD